MRNMFIENGFGMIIPRLANHIMTMNFAAWVRVISVGLRKDCPSLVSLPHTRYVKILLYKRLSRGGGSSILLNFQLTTRFLLWLHHRRQASYMVHSVRGVLLLLELSYCRSSPFARLS